MKQLWRAQAAAVIRLELKKTLFARRGLWIYFLAFAPVALFLAHSLVEIHLHGVRREMARRMSRPLTEADFAAVHEGMTRDEVVAVLGRPAASRMQVRTTVKGPGQVELTPLESLQYSDGRTELIVWLRNGTVAGTGTTSGISLGQDSHVFAGVFQFFFLRLAVFFGCLGIFMNLFRGEMLDKSMHFYLLAPIRREVLLAGKYLAGLLAATVIFASSTALQIAAMLVQFDSNAIDQYLYKNHGFAEIASYLGITVLACVGYGSVFLAAGLLFRNPIIPAAFVLIWEAANPILPSLLKKVSVIYYLKSLCPVQIPIDPAMPPLIALLVSNAQPISAYVAVIGLFVLSAAVLATSMKLVHTLEINYTTE
ncbi:MAG: hypothetical protein JO270_05880 [Acidobacteriaceae bacterium]|nr:hypothetical protein [Acidobacteriaceae bacterium]MBV8569844.1 hypothetical protein [Acidobacteriaceae bacterium]